MRNKELITQLHLSESAPDASKEAKEDFKGVGFTAKLFNYFRTFSEIPYSQEVNEIAGYKNLPDYAKRVLKVLENFEFVKEVILRAESRFISVSDILERKGIKNVLELASGLSMRGTIKSSEPNFHYVESDLPENLEEKKRVLSTLQKKHPEMRQPEFREINVLDLGQLRKAADSFSKEELAQGSFAIVCEGLLGYLDFEQKRIAANNIRQVLLEKGGIWITTDVTTKESLKKIWGNPLLAPLVKRFAKDTKKDMYENSFDNLETLIQFYQSEGFETELVSDDKVAGKLTSPKKLKLSPQQVHQALRKHYTLVLKPKKEFPVSVE